MSQKESKISFSSSFSQRQGDKLARVQRVGQIGLKVLWSEWWRGVYKVTRTDAKACRHQTHGERWGLGYRRRRRGSQRVLRTHRLREQPVAAKGKGSGERMEWECGTSRCKLLRIKCISSLWELYSISYDKTSVEFSSVTQSCPTFCDPMNHSMPGLPVHHQLPEPTQTHVHCVSDAIQTSHPLSSLSSPAFNLSQHQGLFQWISSLHQEFQLHHQSFQWIFRTDFL